MATAKAAVFLGAEKPFEVREFPVTAAPVGYGRSRLVASGICGTDVHFHKGRLSIQAPTVIGHEFVGRLDDLDEAEGRKYGLKKGDYVLADIAVPCGDCLLCHTGDDANCVRMQVTNGGSIDTPPYLYGGYTEVNYTPLSNLIKIPEVLDPAMTAIFACPGPTIIHATELAKKAGMLWKDVHSAVVQGVGPVGLFAVMYLKAMGVGKVYAIGVRRDDRRAELAKALGADCVYSLKEQGTEYVADALRRENAGLGVDLCVETSGAPEAVPFALDILRNRGVYLIPGQYSNSGGVEIQPQMITFKALRILGSSQYSMCDVYAYLQFLCDHPELHSRIRPLANCYPVSEINQAFADMEARKNIKTVLVP